MIKGYFQKFQKNLNTNCKDKSDLFLFKNILRVKKRHIIYKNILNQLHKEMYLFYLETF